MEQLSQQNVDHLYLEISETLEQLRLLTSSGNQPSAQVQSGPKITQIVQQFLSSVDNILRLSDIIRKHSSSTSHKLSLSQYSKQAHQMAQHVSDSVQLRQSGNGKDKLHILQQSYLQMEESLFHLYQNLIKALDQQQQQLVSHQQSPIRRGSKPPHHHLDNTGLNNSDCVSDYVYQDYFNQDLDQQQQQAQQIKQSEQRVKMRDHIRGKRLPDEYHHSPPQKSLPDVPLLSPNVRYPRASVQSPGIRQQPHIAPQSQRKISEPLPLSAAELHEINQQKRKQSQPLPSQISASWPKQRLSPYLDVQNRHGPEDEQEVQEQVYDLCQSLEQTAHVTLHVRNLLLQGNSSALNWQDLNAQLKYLAEVGEYDAVACKQISARISELVSELAASKQKLRDNQQQISSQENSITSFKQQLESLERENAFQKQCLQDVISENAALKAEANHLSPEMKAKSRNGSLDDSQSENAGSHLTVNQPEQPVVAALRIAGDDNKVKRLSRLLVSKSLPASPIGKDLDEYEQSRPNSEQEEFSYTDVFADHYGEATVNVPEQQDAKKVKVILQQVDSLIKHRYGKNVNVKVQVSITAHSVPRYDLVQDIELRQNMAATQVQKHMRGYMCRKEYRKLNHRRMIIKELLETELTYVRGLLSLYEHFVIPLRIRASQGRPLVSHEQLNSIFYQIKEIMLCNAQFLLKFCKRITPWNNWKCVGDLFCQFAGECGLYTHFVNNYSKALLLYKQQSQSPQFMQFLQDIKSKQGRLALSFTDLFITPIQRIPRYVLLLKELAKKTAEDHRDALMLQEAIQMLQTTAKIINDRKRDNEKAVKVANVDSKLSNAPAGIVMPDRRLIYEGEIGELTENGRVKSRKVFLFNDMVMCTAPQRNRFKSGDKIYYDFKWSMKLVDMQCGPMERIHDSRLSAGMTQYQLENAIGLLADTRKILIAASKEHMERWLQSFAEAKIESDRVSKPIKDSLKKSKPSASSNDLFIFKKDPNAANTNMKQYVSLSNALKLVDSRINELEKELSVEAKVLQGLSRLEGVLKPKQSRTVNGTPTSYLPSQVTEQNLQYSHSFNSKSSVSDHKSACQDAIQRLEEQLKLCQSLSSRFSEYIKADKQVLIRKQDISEVMHSSGSPNNKFVLYFITS
ncbi:hypothetical protein MP228_004247 [Amoeboaphelidium protococcarum]|nr:hypothetical protein MP228_004247 [Amoeboaphelidium protococcarum]